MLRVRGDRTGQEQPLWLKPDSVCLHMTMCYALMENNVDIGLKMVLKVYRPGVDAAPGCGWRRFLRLNPCAWACISTLCPAVSLPRAG